MIPDTIEYREAIGLAAEGFAVFPLHRARIGIDGISVCTCGKDSCDGKHPRVPFSEWATTSKETLTQFWKKHPESNIGIHLGKSHVFVVDIDGPEGMKEFNNILQTLEIEETITRMVASGRKDSGTHLYFSRWIKPTIPNGILSPNVHIKGSAGNAYVVAPPSLHVSGNRYSYVHRCPPNDADPRLIDLILSKKEPVSVARTPPPTGITPTTTRHEIPLTRILSPEQLGKLHDEGNLIIGLHPVHPTIDSPREFSIDKTRNQWRCWWHQSGGGLLELAAMLTGICRCDEFTRDALIKPLSGKNFARSITAAHRLGIPEEDLRKFLGLMP